MGNRYLEIFCREAEEHLASLQSGLLVLEKNPARTELLHELLRNAHTLKGSARMVGLADISAITHTMEELLKGMEQGLRRVDSGYGARRREDPRQPGELGRRDDHQQKAP